jgi:hypothetical protein
MLAIIILTGVINASAPAVADTYTDLHVASLLAATPQLERQEMKGGPADLAFWAVKNGKPAGDIFPGGYVFPQAVSSGVLRNHQEVLIIPLLSGGSGDAFSTILYTRKSTGPWRFVGYLLSGKSGKLGVTVKRGELIASTPIFRDTDANCCPWKWHYVTYTLDGTTLRKLRTYDELNKDRR